MASMERLVKPIRAHKDANPKKLSAGMEASLEVNGRLCEIVRKLGMELPDVSLDVSSITGSAMTEMRLGCVAK